MANVTPITEKNVDSISRFTGKRENVSQDIFLKSHKNMKGFIYFIFSCGSAQTRDIFTPVKPVTSIASVVHSMIPKPVIPVEK